MRPGRFGCSHPQTLVYLSFTAIYLKAMKPLLYLANAFINTFGITQPKPGAANRAAWFIAIMLLGVIASVAAIAGFAIYWLTRH
jgi:hypothetical protein